MSKREYSIIKRNEEYMNRTIAVKKQKAILLITFIIALVASSLIISSNAYADNNIDENIEYSKQYKSVMIYSGDTLDSIALEYMGEGYASVNAYINEVMSINNINVYSNLVPGNHIIVPYYECIEQSTEVIFTLALN